MMYQSSYFSQMSINDDKIICSDKIDLSIPGKYFNFIQVRVYITNETILPQTYRTVTKTLPFEFHRDAKGVIKRAVKTRKLQA